jgi:PIN domain nuclease of toxin-antitoxin system
MRLLLDTHVAIHFVTDPRRIAPAAFDLIMASSDSAYVSAASIWEIGIKHALNPKRGAMPFSAREAMTIFEETGFRFLDVTPAHAAAVADLPPIHADPFDRLLVAQAFSEPMRLVTADKIVARYSDMVILA